MMFVIFKPSYCIIRETNLIRYKLYDLIQKEKRKKKKKGREWRGKESKAK